MAAISFSTRKNIGRAIVLIVFLEFTISIVHAAPTHTFVVNTFQDSSDSNTGDHICDNGWGGCSLRAAIEQANATSLAYYPNPVTIDFDDSLWTGIPITLNMGTMHITAPNITIDGGSRNIRVSGLVNGSGQDIFEISSGNITIRNLTIQDSPHYGIYATAYALAGVAQDILIEGVKLIGNHDIAIVISSLIYIPIDNVTIRNTLIGTTSASSTACVTSPSERNGIGIMVIDNVTNVLIDTVNVVCNSSTGIALFGLNYTPSNVIIQNSLIGTNGATDMGNGASGIEVNNTIGTPQIQNNVISGNDNYGVWLDYNDGARLTGNKIGMNASGTAALANAWEGIAIKRGSANNIIGGFALADRNWIGGNGYSGILIIDSATHSNLVSANYIGLGPSGCIPNGYAGIAVLGGYLNIIGVASTTVPQVISCNNREGIYIENSTGTAVLDSNLIGVEEDGNLPRGNGREGIKIVDSTNSSITPGRVSYNGDIDVNAGAGIAVIGSSAWNNGIRPGQVDRNSQLPIDLGNDGPTNNGSHPDPNGPNKWIPYPEITSRTGQTVNGRTCAYCRVDIYSAYQDPRADSGGGTWVQYTTADNLGIFHSTLPDGVGLITMTATDSESGTSEMSSSTMKIFLPSVIR